MINQKELAKRLRLSQPTISRAMRNASDISLETRERVLHEIKKLGMQVPGKRTQPAAGRKAADPSRFFYVLCAGSQPSIGLASVLYMNGLSEEAKTRGIALMVHQVEGTGRELLQEDSWPVGMGDGLAGGLVLVYQFDPGTVHALARRFPVVTITHWVPDAPCDHVDSDHIGGMMRLVRHLTQLGHRRIGFLMHSGRTGYERSRYVSTIRAMMEDEVGALAAVWTGRGDTEETYQQAAQAVVDGLKDGITAWMGDSDKTAATVTHLLEARGVRIPEQVSITGFDQLWQSLSLPSQRRITTVTTPIKQMGQEAIRLLLRRMEMPEVPHMKVLLDTPLAIGDTTGPAPAP